MNNVEEIVLYTEKMKFNSILEERKYLYEKYKEIIETCTKSKKVKCNVFNIRSIYNLDKRSIYVFIDLSKVDEDEFATIILDTRKKIYKAIEDIIRETKM